MGTAVAAPKSFIVPSVFQEIGEIDVETRSGASDPYVAFAHPKQQSYNRLVAAIPGIAEGEPVFIPPEPAVPFRLNPFRFFLLSARQFWGSYDQQGKLLSVKLKEDRALKETIESVLLVFHQETLLAAQCTWKTTKCPGVSRAVKEVKAAENDNPKLWAERGADYAYTLRIDRPWGRVVTTATPVGRVNRTTNVPYKTLEAMSHPTSAGDLIILGKFLQGEENCQKLASVAKVYRERVKRALALVQK